MSDTDSEVVRLIRDLLVHTDKLGAGHQTRAKDIARRLDQAGKVIIDKGAVSEPRSTVDLGRIGRSTI
jgi:methylmalonyl-CoA mutase cobalamin-binding subunit